jgi:hypothetical protein
MKACPYSTHLLVFSFHVFKTIMNVLEGLGITFNAIILALFYTVFGALISYIFYNIFDEYDEAWEKKSNFFKFTDVILEISIIAIMGLWSYRIIDNLPPFFSVNKNLDSMVDEYMSGIFFTYAMFLFLDELANKIRFLHEEHLGPHFKKLIPQHGSIVDLTLSYSKTDTSDPQ